MRRPSGGFQDSLSLRETIGKLERAVRNLKKQVGWHKMQAENWKRIAKARGV